MKYITYGNLVNLDDPQMGHVTSYTVLSLSPPPLSLTIDNYQHRADVRKALTLDNNWNECLSKIRPMFISQVSCAY